MTIELLKPKKLKPGQVYFDETCGSFLVLISDFDNDEKLYICYLEDDFYRSNKINIATDIDANHLLKEEEKSFYYIAPNLREFYSIPIERIDTLLGYTNDME